MMKISEFISYLEQVKEEHGDLSVVCVTPVSPDFGSGAPSAKNCRVFRANGPFEDERSGIETDKFLYIGMD